MTPKYIDIHAHVNFSAFDADRDGVIKRALENETWMMNVGTQKDTSQSAVDLARKYPEGVYAAVGLHPIHTSKSFHDKQELGEPPFAKAARQLADGASEGQGMVLGFTSREEVFDYDFYKKLASDPKVLAIGECGLDYYRLEPETAAKQKESFIAQIELALELGKPLMLHIRNAYGEALEILRARPGARGDVHFFAGTLDEAREFLDLGFTLSFTGVITFARDYDEIIRNTPLDMILSETDCPYVAPAPFRGKRNEPSYVSEVVKKIAEIKNLDFEICRTALLQNALSFANIH